MKISILARCLPLLLGLSLVGGPAAAQRGEDIGRAMEREYGVVDSDSRDGRRLNQQLDEVVERITGALNNNNRRRGGDFRVQSAKILGGRSEKHDGVVNAFALPDGRIYVTMGLMRMLEKSPRPDDELAFVVGHEMTHVVERHSAEQTKKSLPYYLGALLVGGLTRSQAAGTIAQYGAAAAAAHYSRTDEYEADKGGLTAMHRAGYDPNASIAMLKRLQAGGGSQNRTVNGWFGSHPLTENRVQKVREMIQELEGGRSLNDRVDPDDRRDRRERRRRDRDDN